MSTASPIAGGKRYTPRFAQGLLDTCVWMPRDDSRGGDSRPISLSSHSHQLCAPHECAPPGRVSTLVCTQAREQPRLALAREIRRHSTQSTLRCSGNSLCPPKACPKRDDVARVDLLPHYCHVYCTDGGRRCARQSGAREIACCYRTPSQCMNRNGMRSDGDSLRASKYASETARVFQQRSRQADFPIPRCSPRDSDSGRMRASALVSREGAPRTCDPFDCRQGFGIHIRIRVYGNPWPLVIRVM